MVIDTRQLTQVNSKVAHAHDTGVAIERKSGDTWESLGEVISRAYGERFDPKLDIAPESPMTLESAVQRIKETCTNTLGPMVWSPRPGYTLRVNFVDGPARRLDDIAMPLEALAQMLVLGKAEIVSVPAQAAYVTTEAEFKAAHKALVPGPKRMAYKDYEAQAAEIEFVQKALTRVLGDKVASRALGTYDQPASYGMFEHDMDAPVSAAIVPSYDSVNHYDDEGRIIEKVDTRGQYGQQCAGLGCTCRPAWFRNDGASAFYETGKYYCEGCALDINRQAREMVCKKP
jgi:hypothetical protein